MIKDIQYLISSCLSLNELLNLYDLFTVDSLLKIFKIPLPNIDRGSADGDLKVVKYLFKKGIVPTKEAIDLATKYGHLNVVKYLVKKRRSKLQLPLYI